MDIDAEKNRLRTLPKSELMAVAVRGDHTSEEARIRADLARKEVRRRDNRPHIWLIVFAAVAAMSTAVVALLLT